MYICLYICIQPNMVHIPPYISKHWYSQNNQLTLEIRELQQSSKTVDLKWFIQRFGDSMVVSLSTKAAKIIGTNRIFLHSCDSALFKGESSVSKIENSHLQLKVKAALLEWSLPSWVTEFPIWKKIVALVASSRVQQKNNTIFDIGLESTEIRVGSWFPIQKIYSSTFQFVFVNSPCLRVIFLVVQALMASLKCPFSLLHMYFLWWRKKQ
jgi:hypothetical protein